MAPPDVPASPARGFRLHWRLRSGGGGPARREKGYDPLGGLQSIGGPISRHPSRADRIYARGGNVYTSAGVTAAMDLALALVEEAGRLEKRLLERPLIIISYLLSVSCAPDSC